jgi:hypothetical protein
MTTKPVYPPGYPKVTHNPDGSVTTINRPMTPEEIRMSEATRESSAELTRQMSASFVKAGLASRDAPKPYDKDDGIIYSGDPDDCLDYVDLAADRAKREKK